ncbi:MAG: hypothetical protein K2N28_03435 [Muribaculaceae bacterium]|nr:hypothetical protein [Muribaculaceae bacterium]
MYRTTLKRVLPAALLFASASAFAQVQLGDDEKTNVSWEKLVEDLTSPTNSLSALTQAVADAQKAFDRADKTEKTTTVGYLATQQEAANKFLTAYNEYATGSGSADAGKIYYSLIQNKLTKKYALTIGFTAGNQSLEEANIETFGNALYPENEITIASLSIYLGQTDGKNNYAENNGCYQLTSYTTAQQDNIVAFAVDALTNTLPTLKAFQQTGYTDEYETAKTNLTNAETALSNAQKKYGTLTLTADVVAAAPIDNFTGTINGDGHVINVTGKAAFTKFTGELSSAAVNGNFATSSNGATLDNVAIWNNTGTYYNGNAVATENLTFGALAYAARTLFGADVANNKLAAVTDANRVYSITVYPTATTKQDNYVTYVGGVYTNVNNKQVVSVGDNVFVKSATTDLIANNVFYNDGSAKNVVIKDRVNFFCPEDITAETVSYDRSFNEGFNSVCLPFEISSENIDALLATYDRDEDDKFWFTYNGDASIAAYTPIIMKANAAGSLKGLDNVTIKKTAESQIVDFGNDSYGTLKNATTDQFAGGSQSYKIFGLTTDGIFKPAGTSAQLPAFRMVIKTENVTRETPAAQASRSIGFRDAMGYEIDINGGLTGVETVDSDATTFEVAGGQGEITINSSADCGNVAVYAMDGKVVANANVVAGTTSVNVPTGLYIVNGKKVAVK